jgi:hypothetical protein
VSPSLSPKTPNISVPYGALVPEWLETAFWAQADTSPAIRVPTLSCAKFRSAGSLVKQRASRRHLQPPAARLRAMLPCARSSASCSDKAPIYRLPWQLLLRKSHLLLSERGWRYVSRPHCPCPSWVIRNRAFRLQRIPTSASLIGRFGSSAFRLSAASVSMSLL